MLTFETAESCSCSYVPQIRYLLQAYHNELLAEGALDRAQTVGQLMALAGQWAEFYPPGVPIRQIGAAMPEDVDVCEAAGQGAELRIRRFGMGSAQLVAAHLDALCSRTSRPRFLTVDLRGNGGGVMEEAVMIASLLTPKDAVVTTIRGRAIPEETFFSDGQIIAPETPVYVQVDTGTASAAELLAAALRDSRGALILGHRTYGKSAVQQVFALGGGAHVKFTTGKAYAPDGRTWEFVGIPGHVGGVRACVRVSWP